MYASALSALDFSAKSHYEVASDTPQFVVLSFDGSKSSTMLKETLEFQNKLKAENKPLSFTYFINAAYFLTKETSSVYQGPGQKPGVSNIGYSHTTTDIAKRVETFNTALAQGNEIASHSVGHFNGIHWSYEDWKKEFTSFNTVMSMIPQINPTLPPETHLNITPSQIKGFRAPELGVNRELYKVLKEFNYSYDASGVGIKENWPKKDSQGIWHIPLGTIYIGSQQSAAIAMDYSLWMHQSKAKETAKKGTAEWQHDYDETLSGFMSYFKGNYKGGRAPVVIANHFSKWNDGVYWEAMKTFAENVCGQPHVECVTFKELVNYLDTTGVPPIAN